MNKRTALITGASQGIGFGVAFRFAQDGITTAIVGREKVKIENAAKEISSATGSAVFPIVGDVSSWSDCRRIAAEAEQLLGSVDILVPNAGLGVIGSVAEANPMIGRA